jgi:iron complex transport system substrate-binding protein
MTFYPQRIVSLQPSVTVTLQALGTLDRVVACTKYCADVVPEAACGRLIVHDSWTAQSAQILAAKPDLVIASVPYQEQAVIEILKAGIPFLALAPRSLVDVYSDIAKIGGIVGEPSRGEKVIASMQNEIDNVTATVRSLWREKTTGHPEEDVAPTKDLCFSDLKVARVYCEEWGKPLIHSQPWVAELVEAAGGAFVGTPGKQTTAAEVLEQDPDVIIAAWCGAGDRVPLEKLIRERHWEQTSAARNKRVFCIRDEYLNTPALTLIHGLHAIAYAMHPELFPKPVGIRQISPAPGKC